MYLLKYPEKGRFSDEAVVVDWAFKDGDSVKKGDLLLKIESSGEIIEIQSPVDGTIAKVLATCGQFVVRGQQLAVIGKKGEEIPSPTEEKHPAAVKSSSDQSTQAKKKEDVMTSQPISANSGNVTPILMPQAGQSMEEGTILVWKVKEGDQIEVGQVIMEIETDKATMEVEAPDAGRVAKIVSQEGEIVEVKVPVAYLAAEDVDIDAYLASTGTAPTATVASAAPAAAKTKAPAIQKSTASITQSGRVKASPAARKAAKEKGIDLSSISAGSGPGGRILSNDVEDADVVPTEVQVHQLTKMRHAIAKNLSYSKQTVPHFYAKTTIDAGLLFSTYRKTKEEFKCSVNDFVTRACAKAIRQHAGFRSQYINDQIIEQPSANIGIAVGTEDGLTVPVVVGADCMNLEQLSTRTRQVVESARNGKMEGMGQGVFTITNLGMFGVEEFSAIINPPESAILAVGAIREGVVVENGAMRPSRLMTVTLSVDHRVIDGVVAAQFLKTLKELLENPEQLVS